ncbi:immunoglobulin domain-containing protein [Megalops cyprinoides]|uniref:immunoglobulin domain-containing protein n=1 Tax=Megalops cyprinoides TaxID=118141 RepID=UPI0018650AD6|nr:immunoglobulin domain-containing protein [Megalops cyprinoides]
MRQCSTCVLLILTFLHTGGSNSKIAVSHRWVGDALIVTCDILSEDRVTQINWEWVWGYNRTKLGTFHPEHGTYIAPEHKGSVEIQGSSSPRTTSLILLGADTSNSSLLCCVFITFPSGSLEGCADTSSTLAAEAQEAETQEQADPVGWWKLVVIVAVVSLPALITCFYLCWRCCSRRQVFQVERTYLTDPQTEDSTREMAQPPPQQDQPEAFDPSKLYTKIKIDYYYGRLWKAYESSTRWAAGPQTNPRRIYYLLGEHLQPEKGDEGLQQE